MQANIPSIILLCATLSLASCGSHQQSPQGSDDALIEHASATLDSIYSHYGSAGTSLLRENYPYDDSYRASYLATAAEAPNEYSYLWPFSGTLSAISALYEATGDQHYLDMWASHGLAGLEEYRDTLRSPEAYSSYIVSAPASDRFYDDNIWIGIDMADMYALTKNPDYLDKAQKIWRFIESGTDDELGGGIYWCEQQKGGKNTCSNAPGSVLALKLFHVSGDSAYLQSGEKLYGWTKSHLQDPEDNLYFDHLKMNGEIGRAKYSYNSGQMLQASAMLYQITGDSAYLADAYAIAKAAMPHFFGRQAEDAEGELSLLSGDDVWFVAVMLRGYIQLYEIDGNPEYLDIYRRNLDYAWQHARNPLTGLFNADWAGDKQEDKQWLLTQAAMSEMYARLANAYSK